jgi:hypothetical protein
MTALRLRRAIRDALIYHKHVLGVSKKCAGLTMQWMLHAVCYNIVQPTHVGSLVEYLFVVQPAT